MKFYAAALLAGATSASYTALQAVELDFINFIAKHGKSYGTRDEYEFRLALFSQNKKEVERLNSVSPYSTYTTYHFADWTEQEKKMLNGFIRSPEPRQTTPLPTINGDDKGINWVELGHVTAVKDQGHCSSCWAFSAVGAVESSQSISGYGLTQLSEQELVDCDSHIFQNYGCDGGNMARALNYAAENQLSSEDAYPYEAKDDKCRSKGKTKITDVTGHVEVREDDVDQFKAALMIAPLSIGVQGTSTAFMNYESGIITDNCGGEVLNHGVLAVGYGTDADSKLEYTLVKNSWNTDWGEDGYVRIALNKESICGILGEPRYAEVPKKTL